MLVILAIVLSVVLIKKTDEDPDTTLNPGTTQTPDPNLPTPEPLELTDILRGTLQPKRFNGTWIDDNSFHYFDLNVS